MTTKEALDAVNDAEPSERLRRFETICGLRGSNGYELRERDAGR
jgi:hypothetical protein